NIDALNNLAWLLVMRDQVQTEEALQLINRAIDLQGPSLTLVDTLAVVLIRAGKLDQAVDQLTNAKLRAPDNSSLALHLAWAFEAKGRNEDARKELLTAEQLGLRTKVLDPFERVIVQKLRNELFPG